MPYIFMILFTYIGQCFYPVTKKKCWKYKIRWQTTYDGQQSTDRYFLNSSEACLNMVHFGICSFFGNRNKNCLHRFTIKVNQNTGFPKSFSNFYRRIFSSIGFGPFSRKKICYFLNKMFSLSQSWMFILTFTILGLIKIKL